MVEKVDVWWAQGRGNEKGQKSQEARSSRQPG